MTTHDTAHDDDHERDDDVSAAPVPRPRPGYRTPTPSLSTTMQAWAPIGAGVLRAGSGVIAYVACLLTLPLHHATPFLIGVSLVMLVGGCTSILKYGRDDVRLRGFSRGFTLVSALVVVIASGIAVVKGPGAFAPDLGAVAPPKAPVDDGTIRFEPG